MRFPIGGEGGADTAGGLAVARRLRTAAVAVVMVVAIGTAAVAVPAGAGATAASATTAPSCTFNGSSLPLVTSATAGSTVAIACRGEAAGHSLLLAQTSLLVGLLPGIPQLVGGQLTLRTLLESLPALGEIDLGALHVLTTTSTGTLDYTYTVPRFSAGDRNATCPPSTFQYDVGVIGCGLVLLDLNTFKVLPGGYALLSSAASFLTAVPLAQKPTVVASTADAAPGAKVSLRDGPHATTYWWLATLAALEGLLAGGSSTPKVTVTVDGIKAQSSVEVAPASYSHGRLTPPRLSGSFTVPAGTPAGRRTVSVTLAAALLGIALPQSATTTLKVT